MASSLSITVYPSHHSGEYLTVSDAMSQILDFVKALECFSTTDNEAQVISWRLIKAHTNSPPFTVVAEAFPIDPSLHIEREASRVIYAFSNGIDDLLKRITPKGVDSESCHPLMRAFKRTLNGIGRTDLRIEGEPVISVVPQNAELAIAALDNVLEIVVASIDGTRTEYGSVEGEVCGLVRWYRKPALLFVERLSGSRVTCVLSPELAQELGPSHKWYEAWQGGRLLFGGTLYYGPNGLLRRVDADYIEERPYTDVSLSSLKDIDILQGNSVEEHLKGIWGQ